ncbi:MAG: site-2 protease family protein [Candidatus Rokubacteria bacterium]|nr:site-2 protease family protein [Candidatus Rokubacteria bacterium]
MVADRLGDPTPRLAGRLTLNPISHIDPLGALALVLAGFGWAKPVPVNAGNLRVPGRDMTLVAVAGPLANFATAFAALVAFVLARRAMGRSDVADTIGTVLVLVFELNVALGIFNLIPLPPLDGAHLLRWLVPPRHAGILAVLDQYGPVLLLVLVISGATRHVIGPAFDAVVGLYVALVRLIL